MQQNFVRANRIIRNFERSDLESTTSSAGWEGSRDGRRVYNKVTVAPMTNNSGDIFYACSMVMARKKWERIETDIGGFVPNRQIGCAFTNLELTIVMSKDGRSALRFEAANTDLLDAILIHSAKRLPRFVQMGNLRK